MSVNGQDQLSQAEFETMLRRWLTKMAGRYLPVLAAVVGIALIIVFVPTTQPASTSSGLTAGNGAVGSGVAPSEGASSGVPSSATGAGNGSGASGSGASASAGSARAASGASVPAAGARAGAAAAPPEASTTVGTSPAAPAAGNSVTATGGTGAAGTSATGSSADKAGGAEAGPAGVTTTTAGASSHSDVAVTGVHCGPGVRQFSWSDYAPPCVPAFHGKNGGATGQGVTGSTITLSYRLANSAQQSAINALAGAANIDQSALVSDLQTYINYFNTQFELYGRKVVLKTFQGQGDYLEEDQGQDLAATQADAVTAHDLDAFGDITFALESSEPYEQDLAEEHVISFASVGMPQSWYQQFAPYEYSIEGPSGTVGLDEAAAVICDRLAGMPAVFAGESGYQNQTRKFGIIYPETPYYQDEVDAAENQLAACGVKPAKVIGYTINVAEYETEAVSEVAQMKFSGVTTVLCACDPIYPILLTQAAAQQDWYPEWFAVSYGDPVARDYNQSEWDHTIAGGVQWPALSTTQAYKAYQLANPGHQPAESPPASPPYYYVAYYDLMDIFAGLQAAGPDLNAASFERGEFSLPASLPGDPVGGQWVSGPNIFDPVMSFSLVWWDPNAVSEFDGGKGAYQWCNGGQTYLANDLSALGSHQQLDCFGH